MTNKVNIGALGKGSRISPVDVEKIVGLAQDNPKFSLAAAELCVYIRRRFAENGESVVVCVQAQGVSVLTDQGAKEYLKDRDGRRLRQSKRDYKSLSGLDRSKLDNDVERADHTRQLAYQGKILSFTRKERRKAKLGAVARQTPGLRK